MTNKQKEHVAIQKAVMGVMEKNLTQWQSIAELKSKYDQFVRNVKKIDDYSVILQTNLTPLKEKRADSTRKLVEQLFPVTSVLGVFAYDMGDKKLGNLCNAKYSELEKMKHDSLVKFSVKALKTSDRLLDQQEKMGKKKPKHRLTDYGLTPKHLKNLQLILDSCIREEAHFKETRLKKKKSKVKLNRSIRENNLLLKKKMDRMMHLFRDTHQAFYSAYIKSRIPAEVPTKAPGKPAASAKPAPAPKAAASTKSTAVKKPATTAKKPATTAKKPAASAKKPATTAKTTSSATKRAPAGRKTSAAGTKPPAGGTDAK